MILCGAARVATEPPGSNPCAGLAAPHGSVAVVNRTGPEDAVDEAVNSDPDSVNGDDDEAGYDDMPVAWWPDEGDGDDDDEEEEEEEEEEVDGEECYHIVPLDDWREHELILSCWCRPVWECHPVWDKGVVVHHSMDGREAYERGERKPS
jgi:hypothetical protein